MSKSRVPSLPCTVLLSSVPGRLVNAANHALGADRVSLFLVDPRERELWCAVSDDVEGWRFAPGTGIIGHVARTGVGVNVADARTLDYFDARLDRVLSYSTRSVLCLPVVDNRGRVLAVLQVRVGHWVRIHCV